MTRGFGDESSPVADTEMQLIDAQQANKYTLRNLARNAIYAIELTAMSKYEDKYLTSGRVSARLDTSMATSNLLDVTNANVENNNNRFGGQASSSSSNNSNDADDEDESEDEDSYDEDDDLDEQQQQPKSEPLLRDRPGSSLKTERAPSGIYFLNLKLYSPKIEPVLQFF